MAAPTFRARRVIRELGYRVGNYERLLAGDWHLESFAGLRSATVYRKRNWRVRIDIYRDVIRRVWKTVENVFVLPGGEHV